MKRKVVKKYWRGLVVLGIVGVGLAYSVGLVSKGVNLFGHAFYKKAAIVVEVNKKKPLKRIWEGMAQGFESQNMSLEAAIPYLRRVGVRYVRLDHVLDGYGVVARDSQGQLRYDFRQLDKVVEEIVRAGAVPYLAVSYMPPAISKGDVVDMPRDWNEWGEVVSRLVSHYSRDFRGGIEGVVYEIWNEPDLFGGWKTYGEKNYLNLYRTAVAGAERVRGAKPFLIGGPATTGFYPAWAKDFYKKTAGVRKDFYSWHRYSYRVEDFVKDVKEAEKVIAPLIKRGQGVFISEWGPSPERGGVYDSRLAGAHLAAVVRALLDTPVDLLLAFEVKDGPGGSKWHGGWGMLTNEEYGQVAPKPRWQALEMLAELGEERLALVGEGSYVKAIASQDRKGVIKIVIVNYDMRGQHSEVFPMVISGLGDGRYEVRERYLSGRVVNVPVVVQGGKLRREYVIQSNEVVLVEVRRK